ncbi:amidohydrolase family protein [Paenibacillus ferrarius]|uniref:amidohydrolase family protein n=1 Tax=Paenibacillus ferrarius TaxID=1469647 RepID=UPI003D26A436
MKIIDTHVHLGTSKFSGVKTTEVDILQAMDTYGIIASLVMPQPTLESVPFVHDQIGELSMKYPDRIYGMASFDPWEDEETYKKEIQRIFEKYAYVAIKLHPLGHNISPLSPRCNKIYEMAQYYDVPVLVHTGLGTPNSLPSLILDPAKRYPKVRFILCHAGFAVYTDEAIVTAKYCDNVYLEPSWCQTYTIKKMINEVGIDRVVLGSDHITNLPVEITKFESIGLTKEQLEKVYYHNPKAIFKLKNL